MADDAETASTPLFVEQSRLSAAMLVVDDVAAASPSRGA